MIEPTNTLTSFGASMNAAACSFLNISIWHPLFTVKTFVMSGKGLPAPSQLYWGYGANLACDIANQAVAFAANHFFHKVIMDSQQTTPTQDFLGGMFSGAVSGPLLSVLERWMILSQVKDPSQIKQAKNTVQIFQNILKAEGLKGLGRGIIVTSARESINFSCFFGLKKIFQKGVEKQVSDKEIASSISYLGAGVLAGAITTPFDLIKTRMQNKIGDKRTIFQVTTDFLKGNSDMPLKFFRISNITKLFTGCLARSLTIGTTMATFGPLTENVPQILPGILKEDTR